MTSGFGEMCGFEYFSGLIGEGFNGDQSLYESVSLVLRIMPLFSLVNGLVFHDIPAYGRHTNQANKAAHWSFLPDIPGRISWILMESPSAFYFLYVFALGIFQADTPNEHLLVPIYFMFLWELHYLHRTIIYPCFVMKNPGEMNLLVLVTGMLVNAANSYICATYISQMSVYTNEYFYDPRLILGTLVYAVGRYTNKKSDTMLAKLRESSNAKGDANEVIMNDNRKYTIPHGFLYEYVSCPNYLGELLVWLGWAIATWSPAGLGFFAFSCGNLIPRAVHNHAWYKNKFKTYPKHRKALVPFIL